MFKGDGWSDEDIMGAEEEVDVTEANDRERVVVAIVGARIV